MTPEYRVRRCRGNKAVWCAMALREDGSEIEIYSAGDLSLDLGALLARLPEGTVVDLRL
jgi:hypothetical protein